MIYVPEPLCPTLGSMQPLWALLSMELWWLTTSALMAACPIAKAQLEFGGLTPVVVVGKQPRTQTSLDNFFPKYISHTYIYMYNIYIYIWYVYIYNMYIFLYHNIYIYTHNMIFDNRWWPFWPLICFCQWEVIHSLKHPFHRRRNWSWRGWRPCRELRDQTWLKTELQLGKIWVCLKIGYIPNYSHLIGIMIINHWV